MPRTGKKITINGSDAAGYDNTKVECFNCHNIRHFARACKSPRNQESRPRNQDNSRKTVNVEDTSSKAMVEIDGTGFDWSYMADDEAPTNMALMVFSDSKEIYPTSLTSRSMMKGMLPLGGGAKGGKITGKGTIRTDEGIFVGYSIISKAFRVYNTRTRKVEENLHITFLENKPMIAGGGPEWLFDIDALSVAMNYAPVPVGTNSNDFAGKGASFDACQSSLETGSSQDYILMPLWKDNSLFEFFLQDLDGQNKDKHGPSQESECDTQERPNAESSTKTVNTVGLVNTATPTYADYPSDHLMSDLEDTRIFNDAYDDKDEGAEADYNNFEIVISVNPIPATRIHKDHPKEQIIGEVHSDIEPKKETQALDDESWVEAINKRDQRGVVLRNKARLVAQGHTQEEGIDYDKIFAPVARIEAIRLFLAYASFMDFTVYQMDVKSAFLYGIITEEVYVSQPLGFMDPEFPDRVYKVEKALDGLHQAHRAWYETLFTYLLENGFRRWTIDKTLFIKQIKNDILLVQVNKPLWLITTKAEYITASNRCGQHNMVAYLEKGDDNTEFHQIVDFLSSCSINYALTQIHAIVDGKAIFILESSVRSDLLFDDEDDKAVHKEGVTVWKRAITTDASLVAAQNSSSPRRQETMRGNHAQTRSERALEQLNVPPLSEAEPLKDDDDDATLAETLLNIMRSTTKDKGKESSKKQKLDEQIEEEVEAKANTDQEIEEMKLYVKIVPDEDIAIDAIPLATKPLVIVEYKIVKEGKISTYHIIRSDGSIKRYTSMIKLLENIVREDLETL
nr:hypothetical protein [Tanacetum cinerariifolium]